MSASSLRLDGVNPLPLLDWELLEDSAPTSSAPVAPHPTQRPGPEGLSDGALVAGVLSHA